MADKYDIYFQAVPSDEIRGFKCFEFGFSSALKVKGAQALVNRWAKTLMTPKGSDPLYPKAGTAFGNLPGSNISEVNDSLQDMITMSVDDATEQVKQQDSDGFYELNEQLQSATLLDLDQTDDGIEVWVLIKNMADEALAVRTAVI